jgi:hypothetical protein
MSSGEWLSRTRFDPAGDLRVALEAAGWSRAYRRNPDEWTGPLESQGFSTNALARFVLENLGGLTVAALPVERPAFGSGSVQFEPLLAATGESDRVVSRERIVSTTLCPIGEWCGEYILLAGGDGCIYAETTFRVVRVGRDLHQALATVVLSNRLPEEVWSARPDGDDSGGVVRG